MNKQEQLNVIKKDFIDIRTKLSLLKNLVLDIEKLLQNFY